MENLELIRYLRFEGRLDWLWLPITELGSEIAYIVILSALFLRFPKIGRQIGIYFGLSAAVNTLLKLTFGLPRPYDLEPSLTSAAAQETIGSPGLPSGHSQNAAFVWGYLGITQPYVWLRILTPILILLIGFSRLSLGVHFLEDVLLGLAIGGLLAWIASRFYIPELTWQISLTLVIVAGVACIFLPESYSRGIAVMVGFLGSRDFSVPRVGWQQGLFVLAGVLLAFVLYFVSSILLPDEIKRSGLGAYLRYLVIVLTVAVAYPRMLGKRV